MVRVYDPISMIKREIDIVVSLERFNGKAKAATKEMEIIHECMSRGKKSKNEQTKNCHPFTIVKQMPNHSFRLKCAGRLAGPASDRPMVAER